MNNNSSTFKIIVLSIFSVCVVGGLAAFALTKSSVLNKTSNLVVWGTIQPETFVEAYKSSSIGKDKTIDIKYVKKDSDTFDADFVEALADGKGPDIVLLREDSLYKNRNRLFVIPYKNFPARDFKDRFISEGDMFLDKDGVVAIPFIVDPMVMYWNKDMFSNNLIPQTPKYWDEFNSLVDKLTKKDSSSNILQSTVALGGWSNITNAKEIVSMIFLQAGTPITTRTDKGVVRSVLNQQFNYPVLPAESAINFYIQFSNPTSANYSWNRSLPSSLNFFLSGNLATYFGFASEILSIQKKNSNLNFDVAPVPQIRDTNKKNVFARMYALAIVKQSKNITADYIAVTALTGAGAIKALEAVTNLPPVRRDLLADRPTDAFKSVFYDSALMANSWIDPDSTASTNTFRDMIEGVTSGKSRLTEALYRANDEISAELQ